VTKFRVLGFALVLALAAFPALAQKFGSPDEAKDMLEKVVAAMKANQADTLQKINKGGFNKDDLYPFCGGPDGNYTAHGVNATLVGQNLKDLKDKSGKAIGQEFYKEAAAGKVSEVSYMWPRPGGTDPVQKVAYVTKVGDQICGVGYYKQA
jgi:signal transduction histidine kinase